MNTIHVVRRILGFAGPQDFSRGLERAFVGDEPARVWINEQETRERTRRDVNPFHFSQDLCDCTSMPGEILHDWLLDHDYPGYDLHGSLGLEDWWEVYSEGFSGEQHDRLWCVLDRVHFFEVVPVPTQARFPQTGKRVQIRIVYEPLEPDGQGRFTDRLLRCINQPMNWNGPQNSVLLLLDIP
jgi:hypothetical protein